MPRYVVLAHDWPTPHFDLLLEADGVLKAWRLSGMPAAGAAVPGEPIADHRLLYLDYEGPISGDRGSVRRVAAGTVEWVGPAVVTLDGMRAEWDGSTWTFG
jgi:hypothetical protein